MTIGELLESIKDFWRGVLTDILGGSLLEWKVGTFFIVLVVAIGGFL